MIFLAGNLRVLHAIPLTDQTADVELRLNAAARAVNGSFGEVPVILFCENLA